MATNPKKIFLKAVHPHKLYYTVYTISRKACNICRSLDLVDGYHCEDAACDFDYCTDCYNFNITTVRPDKLFPGELNPIGFYQKTVIVKKDNSYYKEIVDMVYKKWSYGDDKNSWSLKMTTPDRSIEIHFSVGHTFVPRDEFDKIVHCVFEKHDVFDIILTKH